MASVGGIIIFGNVDDGDSYAAGGILGAGNEYSKVYNCLAWGDISYGGLNAGLDYLGGIAGSSAPSVQNCVALQNSLTGPKAAQLQPGNATVGNANNLAFSGSTSKGEKQGTQIYKKNGIWYSDAACTQRLTWDGVLNAEDPDTKDAPKVWTFTTQAYRLPKLPVMPAYPQTVSSLPVMLSSTTFKSIRPQTYTGQPITPTLVPAYGIGPLTAGQDYTAVYSNNTEVGTATVTVTALETGNCIGSTQMTFKIVPVVQPDVSALISKMYKALLNHDASQTDLTKWTEQLKSGEITLSQFAADIVFGAEYKERNLGNEDFVKSLYLGLLNREADSEGLSSKVNALSAGTARETVFNDFVGSTDFAAIAKTYSLTAGSGVTVPDPVKPDPGSDGSDSGSDHSGSGSNGSDSGSDGAGTGFAGNYMSGGKLTSASAFVTQLYNISLNRKPDNTGLAGWTDQLNKGHVSLSQVAAGIFFSAENKARNLCNEDFVISLYRSILSREPSALELSSWVNGLHSGMKREAVFNTFILSTEFAGKAKDSGFTIGSGIEVPPIGTVPTGPCSLDGKPDPVSAFIMQLYNTALDRRPTDTDLHSWVTGLRSGSVSGSDTARSFFAGAEFTARKLEDKDFIYRLYLALLGREPSADELSSWLNALRSGTDRNAIFDHFAGSTEFAGLCTGAGIRP